MAAMLIPQLEIRIKPLAKYSEMRTVGSFEAGSHI
jgi:hypothetical protein